MSEKRSILVTGATGQQGGAVTRHLLTAAEWRVLALVRDPDTPAAVALREAGAELVRGNLDDAQSLREALAGVYGVFSVQTFMGPDGVVGEIRQSRALTDAAKEAGVQHFVYSSIDGADRDSGVPHFESKHRGEQYIRSLGLPATILRLVSFMDNFATYATPPLIDDTIVMSWPPKPDTKLQMIAVDDIGAFAALAFAQPDEFIGRTIALAGDELTMTEVVETFTKVTGIPARYTEQDIEQVRAYSEDLAAMYEFFENKGFQADIPALRKMYPQLTTLEDWLRRTNWQPAPASDSWGV
ncbi:NmrA/HSCARG family protein [Micromonospora phytophila]|uniref:NmrA/HSCARG family protein n=1 Tax=Micromonospora phytophila TaxID=709888 RepID=UPI00202FD869|nr:NmrA/HSCARG family protein [Micromonospora phytophila]MCM0673394.1 NmrA/HSCARG family protein [Micromonospora phytophila]